MFVLKFRARSGRQRWLKLGTFGPLTAEHAREKAKLELARVIDGEDPADERDQLRTALTMNKLCDLYLEAADAGLVLGRKGMPKKQSTIDSDRCRIGAHHQAVDRTCPCRRSRARRHRDVETRRGARQDRQGPHAGAEASVDRARRQGRRHPAPRHAGRGIRLGAGERLHRPQPRPRREAVRDRQKKALLTSEQYHWLARSLDWLDARLDRHGRRMHSAVGLAAIRFIALTGVRRGEAQNLRWDEVDLHGTCIALGETKTGPSLRPLSRAAFALIDVQPAIADHVFAGGSETRGYWGLAGLWRTVPAHGEAPRAQGSDRVRRGPAPGGAIGWG